MPQNKEHLPPQEQPSRGFLLLNEAAQPHLEARLTNYRGRIPSKKARQSWAPEREEWGRYNDACAKIWLTEHLLGDKKLERAPFQEAMSLFLEKTLDVLIPPDASEEERASIRALHQRRMKIRMERAWKTVQKENEHNREKLPAKESSEEIAATELSPAAREEAAAQHTRFIAPSETGEEDVFDVILQKVHYANQYIIGVTSPKKCIDMNFVVGPSQEKAQRVFEAVKTMGRSVTFERVKETIQQMLGTEEKT